ncbi:MAG: MMPL family transporter [Candidatus Altarchaeum sp.]|nr:MMPL family transporter [Candidatus Altarchaeum sp.]
MYSKLTAKIPYKILMAIPIVIAVVMLVVIAINGFQMSFAFSGGMLLEIYEKLSDSRINELHNGLNNANLQNLLFSYDGNAVKITTTSKISNAELISLAEKYIEPIKLNRKNIFAINLNYSISRDAKEKLESRFGNEITITGNNGSTNIIIERKQMSEKEMKKILSDPNYNIDFIRGTYSFEPANANVGSVSPVLGAHLMDEMIWAFAVAVILITIVIFIAYHIPIPTLAILAAASIDIIFAAGCMSIFGIELNLTTMLALVMLLGYSVDTDILLTTRILNRKTSVNETIDETIKTGLTMTFAAIGATMTIFIVSNLMTPKIEVLSELSIVILCGLFMDIFSTWLMNTGILKWYVERKTTNTRRKKLFKFSLFNE